MGTFTTILLVTLIIAAAGVVVAARSPNSIKGEKVFYISALVGFEAVVMLLWAFALNP